MSIENESGPEMLSAVELYAAKEFLSILKPFEIATKIICGEKYVTCSKIISIIAIIEKKLNEYSPKNESATELTTNIKKI